ncbi:MAG: GAF domain-containing protein [Opitutales bacterium]
MKTNTEKIADWIAAAGPLNVGELVGETTRFVCANVFEKMGACEGSLWWNFPDSDYLEVCYNSGAAAERLVGQVRQPLSEGIISLVFHTGEPAYTNQINENPDHSKQIDIELSQQTSRMLASPLMLGEEIVGVISAVVLSEDSTKRFEYSDLESAHHLTEILQSLWERHVMLQMDDAL